MAHEIYSQLQTLLDSQAQDIFDIISRSPNDPESPFVRLPTSKDADASPGEISRLVAISSNEFAKATRLASIARALMKMAEGEYKQKFKMSLAGPARNKEQREALAQSESIDEYNRYILYSSLVELAESWEAATRIASESSRRMLLAADTSRTNESRLERFGSSEYAGPIF